MTMPSERCLSKFGSNAAMKFGFAMSSVSVREYKKATGSAADVQKWDADCAQVMIVLDSGDNNAAVAALKTLTPDAAAQAFMNAIMQGIDGSKSPMPGWDEASCSMDWTEWACFCNWCATRKVAPNDLVAMIAGASGSGWYDCDPSVKSDPAYACVQPPCTGAAKKSWTPWIIGGAAVVALGGVAYALTRKPARGRGTVAAANPAPTSAEIDVFAPGRIMPDAKKVGKKVFSSGRVEYWYQLRNGGKMVYTDREQFRYSLRNSANVSTAEQLVKQLDREVPSA